MTAGPDRAVRHPLSCLTACLLLWFLVFGHDSEVDEVFFCVVLHIVVVAYRTIMHLSGRGYLYVIIIMESGCATENVDDL